MGEYYIASTYEEQRDIIMEFYENTNYMSLVIIDEHNMIEQYKGIRNDLGYSIGIFWLTPGCEQFNNKAILDQRTFQTGRNGLKLTHNFLTKLLVDGVYLSYN